MNSSRLLPPGVDLAVAAIIIGPAPDDSEALMFLLEQNYLGVGSGDATFSVEKESGAVVLYRAFEVPMDPASFTDAFGRMAGAARAARAHLAGTAEPPAIRFPAAAFFYGPSPRAVTRPEREVRGP